MLDTIIQKKIQELPSNIRHAVENFDWATEILHIADEYHLQIDAISIFRRETLLVIVGLTDAADFEKNLMTHLEIDRTLADKLVTDANQHIFRPLQKMAFTHHEPEIEEIVEHSKIVDVMNNHGIELVDEFEPEPRPKNELQDLADSLFQTKIPDIEPNTEYENEQRIEQEDLLQEKNNPVIDYYEPIEDTDLRGISAHRIDTSILEHSVSDETKPLLFDDKKIQNLERKILKTPHISKTETFDASPSKEEQILENGDFLKHIGAV